jgi:dTDP-4-amino-4,6-dideoxygalactose transaminase
MDPILEVARGHGLFVIEDACQAHGAQYKGRLAGSIGDAGSFSFYPGKNLGAYGEAGAVVTNSLELAEAVRSLRDHGQTAKYRHNRIGWNGRMDGLQGAVLSIKLRHLPDWNAARIRHAATYTERLSEMEDIILPIKAEYAHHIFHIYAIRVAERDRVMDHLADMGVSCGIHYPVPVHRQQAYDFMGLGEGSFPASEKCARQLISLPMFPELTDEQIRMVTDALKRCLG